MKRYCFRRDSEHVYYLVEVRRLNDFERWLTWYEKVDKNAECYSDKFPIGNRESLEPPKYARRLHPMGPNYNEYSFEEPRRIFKCGKKIECGSTCIDELGHDGDCLCAGDEDGESGTCPA